MPWIPFHADEDDFRPILERLSADGEIAFILPNGRGKWIAAHQVPGLPDGVHCLWHIPGGPLPLLPRNPERTPASIPDPFAGWTEQRPGLDTSVPFFGSIPNIFHLTKAVRGVEFVGAIGLSSFGWIGSRYRSLGLGARSATQLWWRRMQRWVRQAAVDKIPRWDSPPAPPPEIWALPSAHHRIAAGAPRDANSHL